jgi:hypothetical protein
LYCFSLLVSTFAFQRVNLYRYATAAMLREFGATDQLGCAAAVKEEMHRWPNNCEMRPVVVVDPSGGGGLEAMFFPGGDEGMKWAAEAAAN